jgi:formyltetrahydrofolate deformylase
MKMDRRQIEKPWAIWKIRSEDRPGLVASCSGLVHRLGGNILEADQHTDGHSGKFFMRMRWESPELLHRKDEIKGSLSEFSLKNRMDSDIVFSGEIPRVAVLVSKELHCLYDLGLESQAGRLGGRIELILSNHYQAESAAQHFGIPFHAFNMEEGKTNVETKQIALLKQNHIDLVVLARYMQILSPEFCQEFSGRIINIHHGFLPAFQGARPYHQAFDRGVKLIGATAHFVTQDLDEGPIIAQDIVSISHRDGVPNLIDKGRDLEKRVLTQAVKLHLEQKVFPDSAKTIVFS